MNALIFLFLASATAIPDTVPVTLSAGPHPGSYLTTAEQATLREKVRDQSWAQEIAARLVADADSLVAKPLDIPHVGGQWSHWYTCKKDGERLSAETPTRHVCRSCGEVYSGFPYDQVYFTYRHNEWLLGIETLGTAYAANPKPAYAERIREILLEYASFYDELPIQDKDGKQARHGAKLSPKP